MKKSRRKPFAVGSILLVLLAGVPVLWQKPHPSLPVSPAVSDEPVVTPTVVDWAEAITACSLEEGIQLARARGVLMRELIRANPEQAIRESLSLSEWSKLPPEIQTYVEQPFSVKADVDVYISCGDEVSQIKRVSTLSDGSSFDTYVSGCRRLTKTKKNIPVQGIRLGDVGALRNTVFQTLNTSDAAAARELYPDGNKNPECCFVTGDALGADTVTAISGGKVFYFRDHVIIEQFEAELQELDALPGPNAGSGALFSAFSSDAAEDHFDMEAAREMAMELSASWTGEARNMYVILVDFDDKPGQPVNPETLDYLINTYVSQQISDMSYRKSYINCTVNTNTYRMPELSTAYTSDHLPMYDHAVAACGVDLSGYETICVYFARSPGITFDGYASLGGEKMWINGVTSIPIITHELGHNYGSYHSHSWDVSGSDPVDLLGTHVEYGDFSDIMGHGGFPAGHFHVQNKLEIQWLEATNMVTATHSGTYRIYRTDHPDTDPINARLRGVRIDKGSTNSYWVGYRQLYPEHEHYGRGTYVLWQQPNADHYPKSHLLDMTPGSAGGKEDGGLALGQTYSDSVAQAHITPIKRGGNTPNEWIDVVLNLGDFSANRAPTASVIGPTNGMTRTSMTFEVNASDPDGDELVYFWDFGDGRIQDNSPTMPHVWMTSESGTGTVRCVVSDMKGGTTTVEHTLSFNDSLGASWPHQNVIPGASHLLDIATDGGLLVAVGWQGFVGTSTNGIDWTSGSVDSSGGPIFLEGLIHDGSQYIAVGTGSDGDWLQVVYTSPDAETWTRRYFSRGLALRDVASANGIRVAVGTSGAVLRSINGQSWNKINAGISAELLSISHAGQFFTAIGKSGISDVVYVSVDGLTWHDRSSGAGTDSPHRLEDLKYCNNLLLAGGNGAGIRYSDTGGERFSTTDAAGYKIPAFAYGNGIYFAAGVAGVNGVTDINLISSDGIDWMILPTTPQEDRNAAAFFKNRFITVGFNGSVWTSVELESGEAGWALWQYLNQPELGLNRDAEDDPDGDGHLNLAEYALGTTATDSGSLPSLTRSGTGTYFQVSYARAGIKPDIDYTAERATNLLSNDWNAASAVVLEDSAANLTVRSAHTMASQTNEFMRLNIGLK